MQQVSPWSRTAAPIGDEIHRYLFIYISVSISMYLMYDGDDDNGDDGLT